MSAFHRPPLRLACFGWVDANAGSCATGHYLALDALLARGHEIDLFGEEGFVDPRELCDRPGYRYRALPQRLVTRWAHRGGRHSVLWTACHMATWPKFARMLHDTVAAEHARIPYDALVFLGISACCRVDGLPVVEWVQGSPWEEAAAFRRQRRLIVSATSRRRYLLYSAYYGVDAVANKLLKNEADLTICLSKWTQQSLIAHGYRPDRLATLPYPIDVGRFALSDSRTNHRYRILHLGRLDPRKRVDLLLDALRLVRQRLPGAELTVVGRPGLVPKIADLLKAPDLAGWVTYVAAVPAAEVPALLRDMDLLVQTSESENFGSSVAEALAAGLPVVVGPTNGTAEFIDTQSRVFSEYTAESIADAIFALAVPDRQRSVEESARRQELATRTFSPAAVASRLEVLLSELTKASPSDRVVALP